LFIIKGTCLYDVSGNLSNLKEYLVVTSCCTLTKQSCIVCDGFVIKKTQCLFCRKNASRTGWGLAKTK